jgi:hypothetical protein
MTSALAISYAQARGYSRFSQAQDRIGKALLKASPMQVLRVAQELERIADKLESRRCVPCDGYGCRACGQTGRGA